MSWIKILTINILVLITLLLGLEVLARIGSTALSCIRLECNFSPLFRASTSKHAVGPHLLIFRPDSELGYVPIEGFDGLNSSRGWDNKRVTITKGGIRSNGDAGFDQENEVLAVGDSFTFGDQVSNDETWPACLERKLNKGVANGGVSGYGAAQALERAKIELKKHTYKTIILSILVGSDFGRDRSAFIKTPTGLAWLPPRPEDTRRKTEGSYTQSLKSVISWLNDNSFLAYFFLSNGLQALLLRESDTERYAVDKQEIIRWVLNNFADINVVRKILLLQYPNYKYRNAELLMERKSILKLSSRLNFIVVDAFDIFSGYPARKIWMGHHTPLGNTLVCDYLIEQAFKPRLTNKMTLRSK